MRYIADPRDYTRIHVHARSAVNGTQMLTFTLVAPNLTYLQALDKRSDLYVSIILLELYVALSVCIGV